MKILLYSSSTVFAAFFALYIVLLNQREQNWIRNSQFLSQFIYEPMQMFVIAAGFLLISIILGGLAYSLPQITRVAQKEIETNSVAGKAEDQEIAAQRGQKSAKVIKVEEKPENINFLLADCTFDAEFEISEESLKTYRNAFPGETGSATVIVNLSEKGNPDISARFHLSGIWNGTTGLYPVLPHDSLVFNLTARRFLFWQKKPVVEFAHKDLTRLITGNEYYIEMNAFPGFAVPLTPKKFVIRNHEGVVYALRNLSGPDKGWYYTDFSP